MDSPIAGIVLDRPRPSLVTMRSHNGRSIRDDRGQYNRPDPGRPGPVVYHDGLAEHRVFVSCLLTPTCRNFVFPCPFGRGNGRLMAVARNSLNWTSVAVAGFHFHLPVAGLSMSDHQLFASAHQWFRVILACWHVLTIRDWRDPCATSQRHIRRYVKVRHKNKRHVKIALTH